MILERGPTHVRLEARFNRDDLALGYVTFRRNDRFIEHFYADRWYNVFEVHDVDDDHIKGWYCNFTRPAHIGNGTIQADDLALDMFVYPDRRIVVLDQEEFDELPITGTERAMVIVSLRQLKQLAQNGDHPFEKIGPAAQPNGRITT
jgi:protein associated with RNAse G/E